MLKKIRSVCRAAVHRSAFEDGMDAEMRFHLDANYAEGTQAFDQFATKNDSSLLFNGRIALADIPMGSGGQLLTVADEVVE